MKRALLVLLVLAACKKTRVKECDDLLALSQKMEKCEQIPPASRKAMTSGLEAMRSALKALEDVGDQASKEQLDGLARTCKMQVDRIHEMYEKVAPECLK